VSSITTWMRLEAGTRTGSISTGLQARIYDPLWLLARQWQVGEFQGEDNGSPAQACFQAESAQLTRFQAGAIAPRQWSKPHPTLPRFPSKPWSNMNAYVLTQAHKQ